MRLIENGDGGHPVLVSDLREEDVYEVSWDFMVHADSYEDAARQAAAALEDAARGIGATRIRVTDHRYRSEAFDIGDLVSGKEEE